MHTRSDCVMLPVVPSAFVILHHLHTHIRGLRKGQLLHPGTPYYPFPRGNIHTMGNIWSFTVGWHECCDPAGVAGSLYPLRSCITDGDAVGACVCAGGQAANLMGDNNREVSTTFHGKVTQYANDLALPASKAKE